MCVIACSPSGVRQPSVSELTQMWEHNPHGAGYMYARGGTVYIHKGFMLLQDFIRSVQSEHFSRSDSVVYHFRISTQAGVCSEMTHPFPLTANLNLHKKLDIMCPLGVAHNGIISLTSDANEKTFSDTSLFIAKYLVKLVRSPSDLENGNIREMISILGNSKFAFLRGDGQIFTVGKFINDKGILLSNDFHLWDYSVAPSRKGKPGKFTKKPVKFDFSWY